MDCLTAYQAFAAGLEIDQPAYVAGLADAIAGRPACLPPDPAGQLPFGPATLDYLLGYHRGLV